MLFSTPSIQVSGPGNQPNGPVTIARPSDKKVHAVAPGPALQFFSVLVY